MSPRRKPGSAEDAGRQADETLLSRRLTRLGLRGVTRVTVHRNRTVMVSLTPRGVLRIHRGYAYADDDVLRAIVAFLTPKTRRAARRDAERRLLAFPVHQYVPPVTRRRNPACRHPEDQRLVATLTALHERLNTQHFGGRLPSIPFRISDRMRTRLGEVTLADGTGAAVEIAVSRRHIMGDGWEEVEHTVLHEMIHQWQAEEGLAVDHGATFRRKAREVGVEPAAHRRVRSRRRAARYT